MSGKESESSQGPVCYVLCTRVL